MYGWIHGAGFDLTMIIGVTVLAVASGGIVILKPDWFWWVLGLDLWFLGYHHVTSTFTRLTFDKDSYLENRFLVLYLPWMVLAGTVAIGWGLGAWALATTYLYWQWFHYTRQSYGIVRIYARKGGDAIEADERLTKWTLYLLPLWGILFRSYQKQPTFLDMDVAYLPTPYLVVALVGVASVGTMLVWFFRQMRAARAGRLSVAMLLYMISHLIAFGVGYLLIEDITYGWLVINVWHNAQYILIVWMYNNHRFKNKIDERHRFLSTLSRRKVSSVAAYFAFCLLVTTVAYGTIQLVLSTETFMPLLPLGFVVVYQTINFHHYIVDGIIWKVRKKKLQENLGIAT